MPLLQEIDANRQYTNHGPLHERLRARLAAHFCIEPGKIGLAGSGTAALIGLILATAGRAKKGRSLCLMPGHTFVATAHAAESCGFTPFFLDVDPSTWALNPHRLSQLPQLKSAGVVVPVAPYGLQPDVAGWQEFARRTGLPVVIDAAAGFDTIRVSELGEGPVVIAISLHATKTFSTAEGGLMLGGDPVLIERALRALNFGLSDQRESMGPSVNGKLSEVHAAIGLAELEGWTAKRAGFCQSAELYQMLSRRRLPGRIRCSSHGASPYALFLAEDQQEATMAMAALAEAAVGYRRWYGRGLHHHSHFAACPAEAMPVVESLTERLVGLPMSCDLTEEEIALVVATLETSLRAGQRFAVSNRI